MKKIIITLALALSLVTVSVSFAEDFGEMRTYIVKKGDKPLDIIVTLSADNPGSINRVVWVRFK